MGTTKRSRNESPDVNNNPFSVQLSLHCVRNQLFPYARGSCLEPFCPIMHWLDYSVSTISLEIDPVGPPTLVFFSKKYFWLFKIAYISI